MALLDAAIDRLEEEATSEFETMVEAVRSGTILAHDSKAYQRWRSKIGRRKGSGDPLLDAINLERKIASLAGMNPEYVVIEKAKTA